MNDGYVDARGPVLGGHDGARRASAARARCIASIRTARCTRCSPSVLDLERPRLEPGRPPHVLRRQPDPPHRRLRFRPRHGRHHEPPSVRGHPRRGGDPDGLIVDADGFVWVALWEGGGPASLRAGRARSSAPSRCRRRHPTTCAFGGPDLDDLYVTSARRPLSADERARAAAGGRPVSRAPGRGRPAAPTASGRRREPARVPRRAQVVRRRAGAARRLLRGRATARRTRSSGRTAPASPRC